MGDAIRYCDRCAQLVSPGDLKSGRGIATDDLVLCVSCAQRLTAAERAGPQGPAAPAGAAPVETGRPRARAEPARAPQGAQARTFAIAVVVAALVTVPVAMLALRDRGSPDATDRPRRPPAAESPAPSPHAAKPQISPPTPPRASATATGREPPAGDTVPAADPSDGSRERALAALASARRRAAELAAKDDFDGALGVLKALPPESSQLVRDELETATDEVVASARKRIGAIEADVTKPLAAADFDSARAQLAGLAKLKTTTALPEARDLAAELKSKIAAAEKQAAELAARRAREALARALAGFDELLAAGDYDGARKHATRAAEALDKEDDESRESRRVLAAAAELAGIFPERQRVLRKRYADLVGSRVDIGTRQRARRGVVLKEVTDEGLTIEWTYRIGSEERSRTAKLPWSALSAKEVRSRLADWRADDPARPMSEAIAALRAKNPDEAERLLGEARGHPLGDWLARKIEVARRGAAEVAAEEAWEKLQAAVPSALKSVERARGALEQLEGFARLYGKTEFAASRADDIAKLVDRLELAATVNFVKNGDFETGGLEPWKVRTDLAVTVSGDNAHAGRHAAELPSFEGGGGERFQFLVYQDVRVPAGQVCCVSAWFRLAGAGRGQGVWIEATEGDAVLVRMRKDAARAEKGPQYLEDGVLADLGSWTRFEALFIPSGGEVRLGVRSYERWHTYPRRGWVDDCMLTTWRTARGIPKDAARFEGHAYKLFRLYTTHETAREVCERLGGHLLTVNSDAEADFVDGLRREGGGTLWIGLVERTGGPEWATGEALDYRPEIRQKYDHPENHTPYYCWSDPSRSNKRHWSRARKGDTYYFVCEWSAKR